jgi:hypothetical protein
MGTHENKYNESNEYIIFKNMYKSFDFLEISNTFKIIEIQGR